MGEDSKKSGEIGEALTKAFLEKVGWIDQLECIKIYCNSTEHKTPKENDRRTHGDDRVLISHSPFYDQRTDVIHISSKNSLNGYPQNHNELRKTFKKHIEELNEIISCAKYDSALLDLVNGYTPRRYTEHIGLLVWTDSSQETKDKDILKIVASSQLDEKCTHDIYFLDGARIDFIYKVIDHINTEISDKNIDSYDFYCPDPGGLLYQQEERYRKNLPLELMISEVIPIRGIQGDKHKLYLYANQGFDTDSYRRLLDLALGFANAWPREIHIGFTDYNEAHHFNEARSAELSYSRRDKVLKPFCFNKSILNELD